MSLPSNQDPEPENSTIKHMRAKIDAETQARVNAEAALTAATAEKELLAKQLATMQEQIAGLQTQVPTLMEQVASANTLVETTIASKLEGLPPSATEVIQLGLTGIANPADKIKYVDKMVAVLQVPGIPAGTPNPAVPPNTPTPTPTPTPEPKSGREMSWDEVLKKR